MVAFIVEQPFSEQQNTVWKILFERQTALVQQHVCQEFITGMRTLQISQSRIETLEELNKKITPLTGWKLTKAKEQYLSDDLWFWHLAKKEWPVSDYIRTQEELDFTPLPDLFHDVFGHLAFLANPVFREISELFAKAFLLTQEEKRKQVARVWWHTVEFGLIREKNQVKLLGAGLISSHKELKHCLDPKRQEKFSIEAAKNTPKARANIHPLFFVVESLSQVKAAALQLLQTIE